MNDNTRALIELVLKTAGQAGSQGFGYLVAYTKTDGVVGCLFSLLIVAFISALIGRLLHWKPRPEQMDDFIAPAGWRGMALIACAIAMVGFMCAFANSMTEFLQPEGAAIHAVLPH